MRMKCLRILPETMPRISRSELSSLSLNMALGNAWETVASISMGSDLGKQYAPGKVAVSIGGNLNRDRCVLQVRHLGSWVVGQFELVGQTFLSATASSTLRAVLPGKNA